MTSAYAFADSLEREIENRETTLINARFNADKFLDKIIFKIPDNRKLTNFNTAFAIGFKKTFDFGNILLTNFTEKETYYSFIESYVNQQSKKVHLIFRLFSLDGGLNYHDYELDFNNKMNYWEISDAYFYLHGENFSKTLRSLYMPAVSPILKKNQKSANEEKHIILKIKEIKDLAESGNYELAYKMCDSIPKASQNKKHFRLMVLNIAKNINTEKYIEEGRKILDLFPDDPSVNLVAIDYYFNSEEYEECQQVIDKLDEQVGGDDLLDFYRGNTHYKMKELGKATNYYKATLENYPYFQKAYDLLIEIYVTQKDLENAINSIDKMVVENEYDKQEIADIIRELYPKLSKSGKFKAWAKK
ncbi:MAG: tetratricopeptide (TPR) repeat protein [Flammeovirgaceae bacterium]|jgi:tetratricopeptide (TPR) repeat protein